MQLVHLLRLSWSWQALNDLPRHGTTRHTISPHNCNINNLKSDPVEPWVQAVPSCTKSLPTPSMRDDTRRHETLCTSHTTPRFLLGREEGQAKATAKEEGKGHRQSNGQILQTGCCPFLRAVLVTSCAGLLGLMTSPSHGLICVARPPRLLRGRQQPWHLTGTRQQKGGIVRQRRSRDRQRCPGRTAE